MHMIQLIMAIGIVYTLDFGLNIVICFVLFCYFFCFWQNDEICNKWIGYSIKHVYKSYQRAIGIRYRTTLNKLADTTKIAHCPISNLLIHKKLTVEANGKIHEFHEALPIYEPSFSGYNSFQP